MPMGHVETDLTIVSSATKKLTVRALVDTGAIFSVIPRRIARELNLEPSGEKVKVATAKGVDSLDLTHATFVIDSKRRTMPILISDHLDRVLLGVIALEAMQLSVNPTTGKLEEYTALLYYIPCELRTPSGVRQERGFISPTGVLIS